jgi:acyl-CoA synthetase (AMP-forming)/AMP-acid ligase II
MIPRYVRFVTSELPKTPTGKFQKNVLRAAGIADCWDRETAGYKIRR